MGKKAKARRAAAQLAVMTEAEQEFDYSIGDPAFAEWLSMSGLASGTMTETKAMGLTAYYRAVALIAGTIAGLPLKVYQDLGDTRREQVPDHWMTKRPAGPFDLSPFSWKEMVVLHLLNHGEAYLKHITNEGGAVIGLWPIHPLAVSKVDWDGKDKVFTIGMTDGTSDTKRTGELIQILGLTSDGLRGMSPLALFRRALTTSQAGETAANRAFTTGSLIRGLVTTEEDINEDDAKVIKDRLSAKMAGAENANDIAFVNRSLKFTPWSLSAVDAQFLESRNMQVEEVSRMFGIPINLQSVGGAVSNWGTGQAEQNMGLQKYVLSGWTNRIESSVSALLPADQFAEFDYAGLLRGTPIEEIGLLVQQVHAGLLSADEARAIRNLPPLPKSDQKPTDDDDDTGDTE